MMSDRIVTSGARKGTGINCTAAELTELAATAKAKVKASARGWSMLSQREIIALAWLADLFLEDGALP
ncbi:MAG: hypothetical protein AB7U46_13350, partial [Paenirhodobacter sp.]|uniref:hypothetical protein n=1 Tax=Paenirhodobacter sp. TaxID=1965326 RepID=UPI003D14BCC8